MKSPRIYLLYLFFSHLLNAYFCRHLIISNVIYFPKERADKARKSTSNVLKSLDDRLLHKMESLSVKISIDQIAQIYLFFGIFRLIYIIEFNLVQLTSQIIIRCFVFKTNFEMGVVMDTYVIHLLLFFFFRKR